MIKVAAIQMVSEDGELQKNLASAERLVEQAATQGARLILLPELFSSGYDLSFHIFGSAEPEAGGSTLDWMRSTASRYGVVLGGTWLEGSPDHALYNTFSLIGTDGDVLLQFSKHWLAPFEPFFFRPAADRPRIVDVMGIGKIGCAICIEGATSEGLAPLQAEAELELVLVPSCLSGPPPFFSASQREQFIEQTRGWAEQIAKFVGVPVVLANKCGGGARIMPFAKTKAPLLGYSTITDGNGNVLAQADPTEPCALLAEVTPERAQRELPSINGKLIVPLPASTRAMMSFFSAVGRVFYTLTGSIRARRLR